LHHPGWSVAFGLAIAACLFVLTRRRED